VEHVYQYRAFNLLFVSRFRVLIVAFSIAICLLIFNFANLRYTPLSPGWFRLIDMAFWILFLGSVITGFLDISLFWKKIPLLSTLLLTIIGIGIVTITRFSSAIYSLLETSFHIQIIGGSIIDEVSYKITTIAISGSFMLLTSTAMSTWFGKPIVFRESLTLYSALVRVVRSLSDIELRTLYIISLLIGFMVRLYPELKYIDLPVGWDTLEYISVARDFSQEPKILTTYLWLGGWRNLPPLLTWIPGLLAWINVDPWFFFKIFPPVVIGVLSIITAAITYKVSKSKWIALISSLIVVFNPYILGQSQQWHRHILGVILLMIYIYLCEKGSTAISRALILIASALSYEVTAVIALLLSIAEGVVSREQRSRGMFIFSASLALLALLWYIGFPKRSLVAMTSTGISIAGGVEYYPGSALKYTITCILLLTPSLAVIPVWRRIDWRARFSIIVLFTAFILPVLSIIAPVDQHRWFTVLLTLLTPYTIIGLAELNKKLLVLVALITVILGSAYPFTEQGHTHFIIWPTVSTPHARGYPWKMEPSLKNITDIEKAVELIKLSRDIALVGLHFYPQLHLYIRNPVNIVIAGDNPTLPIAIRHIVTKNLSRILVVTTVNITNQLEVYKEKPELYNATIALYLGKEEYVSIDNVKCQTLYTGSTLNIYVVEIVKIAISSDR